MHIVDTYHIPSKQELQRINQLIAKLKTKHGQRYLYISDLQNVFEQMKNCLLKHMEEEEQIVFPLVINLEDNNGSQHEKLKKYLGSLDNDHLETGKALERIKNLTNGYIPPSDACMTHIVMLNSLERLERNLHEHIHKENQILFLRAKAML
jgi:regulator of cell morphogenesis and NO signaling